MKAVIRARMVLPDGSERIRHDVARVLMESFPFIRAWVLPDGTLHIDGPDSDVKSVVELLERECARHDGAHVTMARTSIS